MAHLPHQRDGLRRGRLAGSDTDHSRHARLGGTCDGRGQGGRVRTFRLGAAGQLGGEFLLQMAVGVEPLDHRLRHVGTS